MKGQKQTNRKKRIEKNSFAIFGNFIKNSFDLKFSIFKVELTQITKIGKDWIFEKFSPPRKFSLS